MGVVKEKDILKSCISRLQVWEMKKICLWHDRVNSGMARINGRWIKLAKAGSPDLISYITHNGVCHVCFFECKAPGGSMRDSQKIFQNKFKELSNVTYDIVTHPNQIDERVEAITDYTKNVLDIGDYL